MACVSFILHFISSKEKKKNLNFGDDKRENGHTQCILHLRVFTRNRINSVNKVLRYTVVQSQCAETMYFILITFVTVSDHCVSSSFITMFTYYIVSVGHSQTVQITTVPTVTAHNCMCLP